jgi:hypothetical protein
MSFTSVGAAIVSDRQVEAVLRGVDHGEGAMQALRAMPLWRTTSDLGRVASTDDIFKAAEGSWRGSAAAAALGNMDQTLRWNAANPSTLMTVNDAARQLGLSPDGAAPAAVAQAVSQQLAPHGLDVLTLGGSYQRVVPSWYFDASDGARNLATHVLPAHTAGTAAAATMPAAAASAGGRHRHTLGIAAGAVGLAVLGGWYFLKHKGGKPAAKDPNAQASTTPVKAPAGTPAKQPTKAKPKPKAKVRPRAPKTGMGTSTAHVTPAMIASQLKAVGIKYNSEMIPFPASRRSEMAAYAQRHYHKDTATLHPTMVVLHFTAGNGDPRGTFASDTAAAGGPTGHPELPGVVAHFCVMQDGTIEQYLPTDTMARHTIGLNDQAIGIEMEETSSAANILHRPTQLKAALALVRVLQKDYGIPTGNVIGHEMANADPHFHDYEGWKNDHTDWTGPQVAQFRKQL